MKFWKFAPTKKSHLGDPECNEQNTRFAVVNNTGFIALDT